MSIETALTKLETDISNAYDVIQTKGGTIPTDKNTENLANAIDSISSSSAIVEPKDINFYDYDGTLLYSYTKNEVLSLTQLPPLPTREGFTCQGWNWSLANIKAYNNIEDE